MENKTIEASLARVGKLVDDNLQLLPDGMPLFNWVEVSPVEMCNRKCVFCPKADRERFPNQPLEIGPVLIRRMTDDLAALDYKGTVVLAGYGEPMMHHSIYSLAGAFSTVARVEVVTDGDYLTVANIERLLQCGVSMILVSMYDGPEQVEGFTLMFEAARAPANKFMLRDRWYGENRNYGVKLTNRAGVVRIGNQPPVDASRPCYYPHYSMMVDWNGDCLLCTQDWNRRVKFGNLSTQSMVEVWSSPALRKYRQDLRNNRRCAAPCSGCNADGTLHGRNHAMAWEAYYATRERDGRRGEGSAA
ncbi:MAG: SPASM domain-containing protein [Gammaproteobacteria bacterium]|nr:SPASM domain-containing protein [Gammaproteobacteria bacterium]